VGPGYKRWNNIKTYFDDVGPWALPFAGILTSSMVLLGFAIFSVTKMAPGWLMLITGFCAGVVWGVVEVFNAKAALPMFVFYKNTSGFLENRMWDGASIALATGILLLLPITRPMVDKLFW
jgi:hypothetical protein